MSGGTPLPPAGSPLGALAPLGGRRFARIHNVILLATAPSTNDFAKIIVEHALAESEEIRLTVIAAGEQTAGRGRAGRTWVPLPGALALSAIVPWPEGPGRVRLPIETGILLARGLSAAFGIDVRLKWPNDLLVDRQKLGGLLIEARSNDEGEGWAVIGIGLNVRGTRADLDARGLSGATSLEACGVAPTLLEGEAPLDAVLAILDEGVGEPCADPLPEAFAAVSAHAPGDLLTVDGRGPLAQGGLRGRHARGLPAPRDRGRRRDARVGGRRPLLTWRTPCPMRRPTPRGWRRPSLPSAGRRSSCRRRTGRSSAAGARAGSRWTS